MSPNTTLVLLLDFKTADHATWGTVGTQLDDLRVGRWLTYWTPEIGFVERAVTVVATGEASFDAPTANTTYRAIFFDAPLVRLLDTSKPYNYASASLGEAIGNMGMEG